MPKCQKMQRKKRSACVGDLRDEVILWDRDIKAPAFGSAQQTQTYSNNLTVWASISTVRGKEIFNGTQLVGVKTHNIIIRFDSGRDITEENVVEFKGNYYDVLEVQNLEERDEWLELGCGILGDKTQENNQ